jgi:hypothetical protein
LVPAVGKTQAIKQYIELAIQVAGICCTQRLFIVEDEGSLCKARSWGMLLGRLWLNEVNAVGVYGADGFLIFGEGGVMKQVPRFVSIHELSTEEIQNIVSKHKAGDVVFIINGRAKDDITTKSVLSTLLELMVDA